MTQRRPSYAYEDLLACGRGELFGAGNAQLPLPPLLMLDRITSIGETGGAHGKGQVVAELKIVGNPQLEWIFSCHFATAIAVEQPRRLGRKTWAVSLSISRSAGRLFGVIKLQSLLVLTVFIVIF